MLDAQTREQDVLSGGLYLWTLYIIAVTCGAALMALEILGGRLLSPFFGASVYVWGSIISVFLIALSSGYYIGGIIADKKPDIAYLAGIIACAGLLTLLIPPTAPSLSRFFFSIGLANYGSLVVAFILFCLPSIGLGMVSPYVVKLGVSETDRLGNMVGKFYAISTFGSIFGTLATTFVLIPLFGVKELIFTLGVILVFLAGFVFIALRLWRPALISLIIMAVLLGASLLGPTLLASESAYKTVYSFESMYNDIIVQDCDDSRYLMFTESLYQTGMNKKNPTDHLFNYTRLMDEAALFFRPSASDFLLIGMGGGSIPKAMLANRGDIFIDAIEIDPAVIRIAYEYFNMPNSPNLRATAMDGRMFLQNTDRNYDVVMLDAYNSLFIPHHLTTLEFFTELSGCLKPGGVIILNVVSSLEGDCSIFFKSLLNTTTQVFPEWRLFLAESVNDSELNNLVLVASLENLSSPGSIKEFPEHRGKIDLEDALVLTDNYAPVEILSSAIMNKLQ